MKLTLSCFLAVLALCSGNGISCGVQDIAESYPAAPDFSEFGWVVEPVTTLIGATIRGVNLTGSMPEGQLDAIEKLMLHYQILFFENQHLTPQQHRDFASRYGALTIHPLYPHIEDVPEIVVLDTNEKNPPDNDNWHTDVTFLPDPPLGAILYAREIPPVGGDTMWSSMVAAYRGLSPRMQAYLDGLNAIHDVALSFPLSTAKDPEAWHRTRAECPPIEHPVVRTHPVTGVKALFINGGYTSHIVGVPRAESDMILAYLYHHIAKPEYTLRHKWKVNDIAFWDNRNTQHYALNDYLPARRVMHRALLKGDVPY